MKPTRVNQAKPSHAKPMQLQGTRARGGIRKGAANNSTTVRDEEEEFIPYQVPADVQRTAEASEAWSAAQPLLKSRLYDTAFRMWIEPLDLLGESENRLVLAGHEAIITWVERRYNEIVGEAIRSLSDFNGGILCTLPAAPEPIGLI